MLRHPADYRQILVVATYLTLIGGMYVCPSWRHVAVFCAACALAFLTAVVNHNHLHQGIFRSRRLNNALRLVLSFGTLYPVSANVPAHNLVHHQFEDDGGPDWADPSQVPFRWNLANLLHFPNVAGPVTFQGVQRWKALRGRGRFRAQYLAESVFAFGLTAVLLVHDFWAGLFFVVVPQLWGARSFLRINVLQHEGCDLASEWNHSRNFVGRTFNWLMMNAGYHTIHHRRAGLHWADLPRAHSEQVASRIDPALLERSMIGYLVRTYFFGAGRRRA